MQVYKKLFYTGILTYLILLIYAILFYKERIAFADAAYYLFHIVKHGGLQNEHFRFGAVLIQVLPALATRLGFSLNAIIYLYSISFSLYYFVCYLLCGWLFKDHRSALVLLLCSILFTTYTFYYTVSELPQGLALMVVLFSYMNYKGDAKPTLFKFIVIPLLLLTIIFLHPVTIIILFYCIAFYLLRQDLTFHKGNILLIAALSLLIYFIKKFFFIDPYDAHALEAIGQVKENASTYLHLYSTKTFIQKCFSIYYWIPIMGASIFIFYTWNKNWKQLALFTMFIVFYVSLINLSFPTSYTPAFYIENLYLPLGICLALPFVYDVLPQLQQKKLALLVVLLISITGCVRIFVTHQPFTARINWEREFIQKHLNEKLILSDNKVPNNLLLMTWGTPYEFWLLSTSETGKTASIVINDDIVHPLEWRNEKKSFLLTWEKFPYAVLPSRYFIFTDTTNGYTVMK